MPETMLAAVAHAGATQFRHEELGIPDLYDGEVLFRVKAAGLNSGQVMMWRNGIHIADLPRPIGMHVAGEVVAVGRGVTRVFPGQRIKPDPILSCGRCQACITDNKVRCPDIVLIGWNYSGRGKALFERFKNGMTAEYMRLPESACVPIPDQIPDNVAAHLGTLGTSLRALRRTESNFGDTLIVTGASGGNGTAVVTLAPLLGITRIIAIARRMQPLKELAELAPDLVRPFALEDLPEGWQKSGALKAAILDLNDGRAADALVDCLPAGADVTAQALTGLKRGGKAVLFGGMREDLRLRYIDSFPLGNYHLEGINGHGTAETNLLLKWFEAGRLAVDEFVTHRFSLEKINDALSVIDSGQPYRWIVINP